MSYKGCATFLLGTLLVPHTVPTVMSYFVTPSKNRLQKAHPWELHLPLWQRRQNKQPHCSISCVTDGIACWYFKQHSQNRN